jgi:fumarate hydratase class II
MISVQVMANDVAAGFGGAGGYLEMNVYKPLIIFNITHSITIMTDGCTNFRKFLVEGTKPNVKRIKEYVDRSLMLVTALSPVIGYDKASKIAQLCDGQRPHAEGRGAKPWLRYGGRIRPRGQIRPRWSSRTWPRQPSA